MMRPVNDWLERRSIGQSMAIGMGLAIAIGVGGIAALAWMSMP